MNIEKLTAADYSKLLQRLFPRGKVWYWGDGSALKLLCDGLAEELYRIHTAFLTFTANAHPETADDAGIQKWLEVYNLPQEGVELPSLAEKRAAVKIAQTAQGGQSPSYFEGLGRAAGYDVEVVDQVHPFEWKYICPTGVETLRVEDGVINSPLNSFTTDFAPLAATIRKYKPAATELEFLD